MMLHLWTQWRGEGGREGGRERKGKERKGKERKGIKGGVREEAKGKKEERMNKGKRGEGGVSEGVREREAMRKGNLDATQWFIVLLPLFADMTLKLTHGSLFNQCTCAEGA